MRINRIASVDEKLVEQYDSIAPQLLTIWQLQRSITKELKEHRRGAGPSAGGRWLPLSGVPGFFRTYASEWSFVHQQEGILIPVLDIGGQIQGLQVRLDDTDRRKFRWRFQLC